MFTSYNSGATVGVLWHQEYCIHLHKYSRPNKKHAIRFSKYIDHARIQYYLLSANVLKAIRQTQVDILSKLLEMKLWTNHWLLIQKQTEYIIKCEQINLRQTTTSRKITSIVPSLVSDPLRCVRSSENKTPSGVRPPTLGPDLILV